MPTGGYRTCRRIGAALVALLCVLVLDGWQLSAAYAAPAWLPVTSLDSNSSDVDPTVAPDVAMDPNGNVIAAWGDPSKGLVATDYRPAGPADRFADPQEIGYSGSGAGAESAPQLAFDANGDAYAVWVQSVSGTDQVFDSYRPAGQTFGQVLALDSGTGAQTAPQIAMDGAGDAVAAWLFVSGTGPVVHAADAPAGGGGFGSVKTLSAAGTTASNVQVAENAEGDAIVVWQSSNGDIELAYRKAGATGFTAAETLAAGASPAVALDGAGDATVVWEYTTTTATIIQGAYAPAPVSTSAEPAFGALVQLTTAGQGTASPPRIAEDASGATAAVFTLATAANGTQAQADVWSGGSLSAGTTTVLGSSVPTQQPQVAVSPGGEVIAGWVARSPAQVVDVAVALPGQGFPAGPEQLSSTADAPAADPTVAVDGFGDAVAAWLVPHSGGGYDVQVDGYDGGNALQLTTSLFPSSTLAPFSAVAGRGLTFDIGVTDVWPAISQISWNFGDGTPVQSASGPSDADVVHTFASAGDYKVSATVSDTDGNSLLDAQQVTIASTPKAPPLGALEQLASPNDCVTGALLGCGTVGLGGVNPTSQPIVSPDGRDVYLAGAFGGVVEFSRDQVTGTLTPIGCVAYESGPSTCASNSFAPLANPAALAISPDGTELYAVLDGSLAVFSRDPGTGELTEASCLTSEVSGPFESEGCAPTNGLLGASAVTVSPDGQNVYVAAGSSGGGDVVEFTPGADGALNPTAPCITDGGVSGCTTGATGLAGALGIAVSQGDVYVAASPSGTSGDVAELARGASGTLSPLTPISCVGGSAAPTGCATTAGAIDDPASVAISPNGGDFVYVGSSLDDAVVVLHGATLAQAACVEGQSGPRGLGCGTANGIDGVLGLALSSNGANLYATGYADNSVAAFSINPDGTLGQFSAPFDCITSGTSGCGQSDATGLDGAHGVAVSPDGRSVYVAGQGSQSVAELCRTGIASLLTAEVDPDTIIATGSSTTTVTATITDACGNGVTGDKVSFSASDPGVSFGPVTDNGDGTYTATATGSTTAHGITITATDYSATPNVVGQALLDQVAPQLPPQTATATTTTTTTTGTTTTTTAKSTTTTTTSPQGASQVAAKPVLGQSVIATRESGTVEVVLFNSKRLVTVSSFRSVPVGSIIDAIKGHVEVTAAQPHGKTETGVFYDGEFVVREARNGMVTAVLTGGDFAPCLKGEGTSGRVKAGSAPAHPSPSASGPALALLNVSAIKRPDNKEIRELDVEKVHGTFSTQGAFGSAVTGTQWLTEDQCDGTYFNVAHHALVVTNFTLADKRTTVAKGHHYLAPAPP